MESTLRSRQELLTQLCEQPVTKPELVEQVSVSRSTVDRAIRELELDGLVDVTNSRYCVTETGRIAFEAHCSFSDTLETIEAATPMLEAVPTGTIALRFLRGAAVDLPDPRAPMRALESSTRLVDTAVTFRGTGPVAFDRYFDVLSGSVANGGLECELVLDRALYESMAADSREALREIVSVDGGSLLVATLDDPFAIWLADDGTTEHAGLTIYDHGGIAGVLRNDDPAAVEWVREQYRSRKGDAELVWDATDSD